MRILAIIEFKCTGHQMIYVRRIARAAVLSGLKVCLFTLKPTLAHTAYKEMVQECGDALQTVVVDKPELEKISHGRLHELAFYLYYRHCKTLIQAMDIELRPEFVLVPYLDLGLKAVALLGSPFGPIPWAGLTMHVKFHLIEMGAVRPASRSDGIMRWLYSRLLYTRHLSVLFVIDELLAEYTRRNYPDAAVKTCYLADPVDLIGDISRESARSKFGISDPETKVLLVFGRIEGRKGISRLVDASQADTFPTNVTLLFAGTQAENATVAMRGIPEQLRSNGRVIELNQYISGEDEYAVFKAADIVWVGYTGFYGMSAVMVQAAKMGLPVIACKVGLIGWMTEKYGTGVVVDVYNAEEVNKALSGLINNSEFYEELSSKALVLGGKHTVELFTKTLLNEIVTKPMGN